VGVRSDLQIIERAVKRRWNFDRELAERAVADGLTSPDDRVKMRALSIAVAMERQNQADEHKVLDIGNQWDRDRLAAIASELGVDESLVFDATRIAGSSVEDFGEEDGQTDDAVGA
jgi:hypothetical protein